MAPKRWVCIQLTFWGEEANVNDLVSFLAEKVSYDEIFFPYFDLDLSLGEKKRISVVDGYFFILTSEEDGLLLDLEGTDYFERFLVVENGKTQTIEKFPENQIDAIKAKLTEKLQGLEEDKGCLLEVCDGLYKGLIGEMIEKQGPQTVVKIKFYSKTVQVALPSAILRRTEDGKNCFG